MFYIDRNMILCLMLIFLLIYTNLKLQFVYNMCNSWINEFVTPRTISLFKRTSSDLDFPMHKIVSDNQLYEIEILLLKSKYIVFLMNIIKKRNTA